ncbi:hypothetical protein DUNSADRAFT_6771, partial [Dunaliella salina]
VCVFGQPSAGSASHLQHLQPRPKSFSKHHLAPNLEPQLRNSVPSHPTVPSPYDPYLQGEGYPAYANLGNVEKGALTSPGGSSPLGHLLFPGTDSNSRSNSSHGMQLGYAPMVGSNEGGTQNETSSGYNAVVTPNGVYTATQGDGLRRESGYNGPTSVHNSGYSPQGSMSNSGYNGNPGSQQGSGYNGAKSRRGSGLNGPVPVSPGAAMSGPPHLNPGFNTSPTMLARGSMGPSSRPNSGYNGPTLPAVAAPMPGPGIAPTSRHSAGFSGPPPMQPLSPTGSFGKLSGTSHPEVPIRNRSFQEAGFNLRGVPGAVAPPWGGLPLHNPGLYGGSAVPPQQPQMSSPVQTPLQKLGASAAMAGGVGVYPNSSLHPPQHGGPKAAFGAPGFGGPVMPPNGPHIRSPLVRLGSALQHELEGRDGRPGTH